MLKEVHPLLLLSLGTFLGAVVTAVYLTDVFGVLIPGEAGSLDIEGGWGSLVGACVGGLFAFGVFWVQRMYDQRDARRKQTQNVLWCLDTLQAKIIMMLDAYGRRRVAEAFGPWEESGEYETADFDAHDLQLAHKALFIIGETVTDDCREASTSLTILEAVWRESDVGIQLFFLRETMQKIAKTYEKIHQKTKGEELGSIPEDKFASTVSKGVVLALKQRDQLSKLLNVVEKIKSDVKQL